MSASQFVGRVGGLAVSLGIGAAVFSGGIGVAFADAGSQSGNDTASAGNNNARASHAPNARRTAAKAARRSVARASATVAAPAADVVDVPVVDDPVVTDPIDDPIVTDPISEQVDLTSVEDPVVVAYNAAPDSVKRGTAKATSSRLSADPNTYYFDGVLQGNLNVTAASGCGELGSTCKLEYKFDGSSDGGKANLGNVPGALPGGGAGSYTFLPYATWISPNNPVNLPTPTGTQTFDVRITENTKFDQRVTSIPLVGLIAKPVINLLQQLPLISNLLAPLIGASLVQTVSVNVGGLVAAGKQVAYTYTISSFDGTPISMNYFPASTPSLVLPGQRQATILNGPGLGSNGATDPYALLNTGGAAPPLAAMRGQGLPAPFDQAPVGFNVITWDPRGEGASGGTLQLDNPFFEGRDVSSLITWANANTPLLNEKSVFDADNPDAPVTPDIAMMGGSYGGGIQMTSVDPRIKAIVPSIAWNSLNESLYPSNVFKAGWSNILALFLLEAGARTNPIINKAIIGANLTGRLTEEEQAVLASSGPTVLLSKLSAPTMYVQGIVDALFPLQQALNNAQTQLDQNPYFLQSSEDWGSYSDQVKMIWFCGGHGVCSTQTVAQQTAQNTDIFLENLLWANTFVKQYLADIPIPVPIPPYIPAGTPLQQVLQLIYAATPAFQWWDQNGTALASSEMPWTSDFQDATPLTATNATGGTLNWMGSRSGPLRAGDPAAEFLLTPEKTVCDYAPACSWPLNAVFATDAAKAVNVGITVPDTTNPDEPSVVVGAPLVSFTYSGRGRAKAVYAQVVDNATGQVLGNINTPIPVILDGKEHTVDAFPIANIAYTAPGIGGNNNLTLQIVARSSNFKGQRMTVSLKDVSVELPRTTTAQPNPLLAFLP